MFLTIDEHEVDPAGFDPCQAAPYPPSYSNIASRLDDLPVLVQLREWKTVVPGQEIVAYVGDNFQGREKLGEVQRGIVATVVLWLLGADRQPYAGPVVLCGINRDDPEEGWLPAPITDAVVEVTLRSLIADVADVLLFDVAPVGVPPEVLAMIREAGAQARSMEYPPIEVREVR